MKLLLLSLGIEKAQQLNMLSNLITTELLVFVGKFTAVSKDKCTNKNANKTKYKHSIVSLCVLSY